MSCTGNGRPMKISITMCALTYVKPYFLLCLAIVRKYHPNSLVEYLL